MADIRYVQEGYVADSYVEITFDVSVTLSCSATVTATGGITFQGNANLEANLSGLTWDEMGTWQEPRQEYWQNNFIASGEVVIGGTINATAQGTLSVSGIITARPIITMDGVLQATLTANLIGSGIILSLGSAQITADADLIARSSATLDAQATLTADADAIGEGIILALGAGTLSAQATITAVSTTSMLGAGTMATDGDAILRSGATFQAECTLSANGIIAIGGRAVLEGVASFAVADAGIFITRGGTANLTAQGTVNLIAGLLADGEADLQAVGSTLIVGSKFAIDPYRVYTVPTETRINILEQETRSYLVPSETRIYKVQHLNLIDEPGILDRREG
jgi:hypothetical protein